MNKVKSRMEQAKH
jgi:hypothetical protein